MKKSFIDGARMLGIVLALGLCGGCSTPWGTASDNITRSRDLRVGMTKSEVISVMGEPIRDESFCKPDLWYHYIDTVWFDGLVTEDECMPLIFEDGKLVGWGNDFHIDYRLKKKDAAPVINPERKK